MNELTCSIQALIACFSWSNFYLDTDLSYRDADLYVTTVSYQESLTVVEGIADQQLFSAVTRERISSSPYGRVAIGHQMRFGGNHGVLELSAEIFHESSLATSRDRGVNGVAIRGRWFPFK